MATAGIYKIENVKSKKVYIGSSADLDKRFKQHKAKLKGNCHSNQHLQNAWNKYGYSAFRFTVLTTTVKHECLEEAEQQFIDSYKERGIELYNVRPVAHTNRGLRHSEQSRKNMSEAQKKRYQGRRPHEIEFTPEIRQKLSIAAKAQWERKRREKESKNELE